MRICLGLLLAAALSVNVGLEMWERPVCVQLCVNTADADELPHKVPVETVGGPLPIHPVPAGFLGLSTEYYALRVDAGGPGDINPVYMRLIRELDPGQSPVLKIGGDSTDWTWIPSAGLARPAGAKLALTPKLLEVLAAIGRRLDARLVLGLDLEAGSAAVARAEALAFLRVIGRRHIEAFELGNEPELYSALGWYQRNHRPILGRRRGYGLRGYERDFRRLAFSLPAVGLAGPASGHQAWARDLARFAASAPRLSLITLHRYPLQRCRIEPDRPGFPTMARLLAPRAWLGLAASVRAAVRAAHAHAKLLRVDEINSVACFGARGVSDTFAAALWALEASLAMARVGVDGLNFHTTPSATYRLFSFRRIHRRWFGQVAPAYYGLLTFAEVAPPGSRLLSTSTPTRGLPIWATETPAGTIHVVLVNAHPGSRTVAVRIPGGRRPAVLSYLRAGSLRSFTATLAGRTFPEWTRTGTLSGSRASVVLQPEDGVYVLRVPGPSAAILTLAPQPS